MHLRPDFIDSQYWSLPKYFTSLYVVHLVVITHSLVMLACAYQCCSSKDSTCFQNTVTPCTVFDFACCVTPYSSANLISLHLNSTRNFCSIISPPSNSKRVFTFSKEYYQKKTAVLVWNVIKSFLAILGHLGTKFKFQRERSKFRGLDRQATLTVPAVQVTETCYLTSLDCKWSSGCCWDRDCAFSSEGGTRPVYGIFHSLCTTQVDADTVWGMSNCWYLQRSKITSISPCLRNEEFIPLVNCSIKMPILSPELTSDSHRRWAVRPSNCNCQAQRYCSALTTLLR